MKLNDVNLLKDLKDLKYLFHRTCTNMYHSYTWENGEKKPMWYRHPDLDKMAKEAFEKGEDYFYCKPKNPDHPNGELIPDEPRYFYSLKLELDEEKFEEVFGKWNGKECAEALQKRWERKMEESQKDLEEEKEER